MRYQIGIKEDQMIVSRVIVEQEEILQGVEIVPTTGEIRHRGGVVLILLEPLVLNEMTVSMYKDLQMVTCQPDHRQDRTVTTEMADAIVQDRRPTDQTSQQPQRPRSDSCTRACFRCYGLGHFIADCPSTHWYLRNGDIDVERDKLQEHEYPNGQRTPPSPSRRLIQ